MPLSLPDWTPTRAAGLARLADFLPHAGRAYAARRNFDFGPEDRSNVSALSPFIRHRLLGEAEVVRAVTRAHGFQTAEKFVQEVVWRTYWKGWLQMRPAVLRRFDEERRALRQEAKPGSGLAAALARAEAGQTGIEGFDDWARELVEIGWLHNHARMWFASIWIFTLRLPWQLGADFFFKHLLDADEASNTLSWRWVAGLHTAGKTYLARAANIAEFTGGRFNPAGQLAGAAPALADDWPPVPPAALPAPAALPRGPVAILLHHEDLHPESWPSGLEPVAIAGLAPVAVGPADGPAARFRAGAISDGLARASAHWGIPDAGVLAPSRVAEWARAAGVEQIVTGFAPEGLTGWRVEALRADLAKAGIRLTPVQRDWDRIAWPHARAGFFKMKAAMPALVQTAAG